MIEQLQIAATALRHGLELVTGNLKHFARVPELTIRPLRSGATQAHRVAPDVEVDAAMDTVTDDNLEVLERLGR